MVVLEVVVFLMEVAEVEKLRSVVFATGVAEVENRKAPLDSGVGKGEKIMAVLF